MTLDFVRLGEAIRARAAVLYPLNPQEELIRRSRLGRSTIQRLWAGKAKGMPTPATRQALEEELDWEDGSVEETLAGGEPTVRRETSDDRPVADAETAADARAAAPSDLPLDLQMALEDGRTLGYEVIEVQVGGQSLSVIAVAKTGVYDTEEQRAVLREQLEAFARLKGHLRDAASSEGDPADPSDAP